MALFHFMLTRLDAVQGDQLLPVLPIVLAKNCTANIMGKPVIIPARAV